MKYYITVLAALFFIGRSDAQVELISGGTGAAYTLVYPANTSGYMNGMSITFKSHIANTGVTTMDVNGLGPVNIINTTGSALAAGDIKLGQEVTIIYDGTNFQMVTTSGNSGSGITGSGTINFVPKWNTATTLTNSLLFDNGTNLGIGTSLPAHKLQLNNTASAGDTTGALHIFSNNSNMSNALVAIGNNSGTSSASSFLYSRAYLAGYGNIQNANVSVGTGDYGVWGEGSTWGVVATNKNNASYVALGGITYPVQIVDGNQGAGKVLTSDASGYASWQTASASTNHWTRNNGFVYPATITDSVGIGTNSSSSKFVVAHSSSVGAGDIGVSEFYTNASGYTNAFYAESNAIGDPFQMTLYSKVKLAGYQNFLPLSTDVDFGIWAHSGAGGWAGLFTNTVNSPASKFIGLAGAASLFTMVDGNQGAGKVMTSDANGNGTWQVSSASAWTRSATNIYPTILSDRIGLGITTPNTSLDIRTTDAIVVPAGTTAQRPGTITVGALRYNSDLGCLEYYDGTGWNSLVPPGTVVAFAGAAAPQGWLLCDGSQVSRVTYAKLFTAIGIAWGSGNNTTTFHLPDMRGRFLRGVNSGTGRDPDSGSRAVSNAGGNPNDAVGSQQTDAFASHTHTMGPSMYMQTGAGVNYNTGAAAGGMTSPLPSTQATGTSTETRPKNVYVNYIIKY